jgi:hypothetical protein
MKLLFMQSSPASLLGPNFLLTALLSDTLNICSSQSRGSSFGIALGYGLDDWGSRFRFSAVAGNFSLHHRNWNGSGAHPSSYAMGTRGSFPGGKAAGA